MKNEALITACRRKRNRLHFAFCGIMFIIASSAAIAMPEYMNNLDDNGYVLNKLSNFTQNNRCKIMCDYMEQSYDPSVREANYAKILYGNKDTAVILLHGFLSSPFEVFFLGKEINRHGFTVLMPLVEGFGGSTKLANRTEYAAWQQTIKNSIKQLSPHYSKIIVIGFSLGGAIVSDYLLNNDTTNPKIQGVILLAPYFSPEAFGGEFFTKLFNLFTDAIPLKTLFRISGNDDLKIPLSNPDYYNSDLPLKAVMEIIKFGNKIRQNESAGKSSLPTLFVYTEDDKTVDNKSSIEFVEKHFQNLQIMKFTKNKNVRHQLAVPAGNPEFATLCATVIRFIENINAKAEVCLHPATLDLF